MEFHLQARYPDASRAFYKKCTKGYADGRLIEIKEAFKWIKSKL